MPLGSSKREYTDEGFLKAPARTARTGIQQYLAKELELDGDPMRVVNVYRPADQVFSADSLASYNGVDITDDHPSEMVNSDNYKALTIGHISGPAIQDGDYVLANLILKDATAIKLVESGKAQLSAGYTAEYKAEPGVTADGIEYEFIQTDIKINHVALVDNPRAGSMARIFDKQMEKTMSKVVLDNGRAVELDDGVAAQVEDSIARLTASAKTAKDSQDAMQAKLDVSDEKMAKLEAKCTDAAIAARVSAIAKTLDSARLIAGKDFTTDSVDETVVQREALTVCRSKVDWSDKSDAYVAAAFDQKTEEVEDEDEEEEKKKDKAKESFHNLGKDMAAIVTDTKVVDARQASNEKLQNAWKGEG